VSFLFTHLCGADLPHPDLAHVERVIVPPHTHVLVHKGRVLPGSSNGGGRGQEEDDDDVHDDDVLVDDDDDRTSQVGGKDPWSKHISPLLKTRGTPFFDPSLLYMCSMHQAFEL
jgi:hypothetical protein